MMVPWLEDVDPEGAHTALCAFLRLQRIQQGLDTLRTLFLYVTRACNQGCEYCWVSAGTPVGPELTKEEIRLILSDARLLGARELKVTGGEPFVREDLVEILTIARGLGFAIAIETNGTLVNAEQIKCLSELGEIGVSVSLDGASSRVHAMTRKDEDSFEAAVGSIRLFRQGGVDVGVVTVAHRGNLLELGEIAALAFASGASWHRTILTIQKIGRGRKCEDIELSWDEISQVVKEVYRLREALGSRVNIGSLHSTLPPALQRPDQLEIRDCGWGRSLCGVLSNGAVSICGAAYETLSLIAGWTQHMPLRRIWTESRFFLRLRAIAATDLEGVCGNCLLAPVCMGMCRVNAFAVYSSLTAPYPLCQQAYERGMFPSYALRDPDKPCAYPAQDSSVSVEGK